MSTQEKIRDVMLHGTEQEVLAFIAVLEEYYLREAEAQLAREKLHSLQVAASFSSEEDAP